MPLVCRALDGLRLLGSRGDDGRENKSECRKPERCKDTHE
jgi:hypothetical protein